MIWIACAILIGQGLIAITIRRAVRTFGAYSEKLTKTHQQNLVIRLSLAIQQNELAAREALRRYPLPEEKKA